MNTLLKSMFFVGLAGNQLAREHITNAQAGEPSWLKAVLCKLDLSWSPEPGVVAHTYLRTGMMETGELLGPYWTVTLADLANSRQVADPV